MSLKPDLTKIKKNLRFSKNEQSVLHAPLPQPHLSWMIGVPKCSRACSMHFSESIELPPPPPCKCPTPPPALPASLSYSADLPTTNYPPFVTKKNAQYQNHLLAPVALFYANSRPHISPNRTTYLRPRNARQTLISLVTPPVSKLHHDY